MTFELTDKRRTNDQEPDRHNGDQVPDLLLHECARPDLNRTYRLERPVGSAQPCPARCAHDRNLLSARETAPRGDGVDFAAADEASDTTTGPESVQPDPPTRPSGVPVRSSP